MVPYGLLYPFGAVHLYDRRVAVPHVLDVLGVHDQWVAYVFADLYRDGIQFISPHRIWEIPGVRNSGRNTSLG